MGWWMRGCSLCTKIVCTSRRSAEACKNAHWRKTTVVQNAPSHLSGRCLKHHISVHTGGKPLNCSIHTGPFPQQCNLNRHRKAHTEAKPLSCSRMLQVLHDINLPNWFGTLRTTVGFLLHYNFLHASSRRLHVQMIWYTMNNYRVFPSANSYMLLKIACMCKRFDTLWTTVQQEFSFPPKKLKGNIRNGIVYFTKTKITPTRFTWPDGEPEIFGFPSFDRIRI